MEVHHHPDVEKKSFKLYLLEGLMIFIAVTLGFFAESLREKINNTDKEKAYIISLTNNLEDDLSGIKFTVKDNQYKQKGLDSLLALSNTDLSLIDNRRKMYKLSNKYVSFYSRFASNDATMMQLKNSGGLQFIKHSHVADSIAQYDQEMRDIYAAEGPYAKSIYDGMDAMSQLLIYTLKQDSLYSFGKQSIPYPLLSNDPQKIAVFFNKISTESGWTENYVNNLVERIPFTTRLIALLKKEYDLE